MKSRHLLVLGLLSAAGCGEDVLGPKDVAGLYRMIVSNGVAVPYLISEGGDCRETYDGGTLELLANGRYRLREEESTLRCAGVLRSRTISTSDGRYRLAGPVAAGERIRFWDTIPEEVGLAAREFDGYRRADGSIEVRWMEERFVFRRD